MSLKNKKICISVVLIAAFFLVAVLMTSSVNLFSLSESNTKVEYSDLLKKINASNVAKFLSSKDKLELINYFYEYQKLKAKINSLSYDELNRFLFLGKYLAKYIDPKYLGLTNELVGSVLNRYSDIANEQIISGVTNNLDNKADLLKNVSKLKKQVEELYDANKISKVAYQEILAKLSDVEYHIDLSSFGGKDVQLDLNDIAKVINKEKASYSINADLLGFSDIEESLALVQKEMDSMKYISEFVNSGMDSIEQSDMPIIGDVDKFKTDQFSSIVNNIDSESLGDILDIVKKSDIGGVEAGDIDFAKTVKLPNITVEGTLEDAWNINFDASSLNLNNLLAPIDLSLISDKSLDNVLKAITSVKVPDVYQGEVSGTDTTVSPSPGETTTPGTPVPTASPSITPDITTKPSVTPSTTPDVSDSPTDVPGKSDISTDGPIESKPPWGDPDDTSVPWYVKIWTNYKTVIKMAFVVALVVTGALLLRSSRGNIGSKKKIMYEGSDNFKDITKIPINYKERLIGLGSDVLYRMRAVCIKDKLERTPREIVNVFLNKYSGCDSVVVESFLKYYESAVFYQLDVDDKLYENFAELSNTIYGILRKEEEGIT